MAMAILAAQDCLDEERGFMTNPRRKSNRSKRKSVGEIQVNPQMNLTGLNTHNFQKNGSFLIGSSSYVSGENLGSKTISSAIIHLPQAVDAKKLNSTTIHQASRTFRYKGSADFQQQFGQKGVKSFLLEKTEGAFRREGLFNDGINNKKIGNDLQVGQVTILKKGEAIKSASISESALTHLLRPFSSESHEIPEKSRTVEASKRKTKISAKSKGLYIGNEGKLKNDGIAITSTDHFGPDPSNLPREGSGLLKSVSSGFASTETVIDNVARSYNLKVGANPDLTIFYFETGKCGVPAFTNSPPPSCLPLPKFSLKQNGKPATTQVGVNTLATRDLRRLLGLD